MARRINYVFDVDGTLTDAGMYYGENSEEFKKFNTHDGKGFDLEQVPSGRFGLRGMHERARLFGGKLKIASSPGKGTRIEAQLPVKAPSGQSTDAPT